MKPILSSILVLTFLAGCAAPTTNQVQRQSITLPDSGDVYGKAIRCAVDLLTVKTGSLFAYEDIATETFSVHSHYRNTVQFTYQFMPVGKEYELTAKSVEYFVPQYNNLWDGKSAIPAHWTSELTKEQMSIANNFVATQLNEYVQCIEMAK
ncbi:hypothetical protein [Shewanella kaireitica]|uniref:hypothetical protein n=1 Tax=Shewanella kaireitica TaxID=212021 RepID=UPI00200D7D7C|nr:hypothetical protein [Shewanella kaireitica]MCL1096306.1 hypothetical protein [Shewanella kaireitica]